MRHVLVGLESIPIIQEPLLVRRTFRNSSACDAVSWLFHQKRRLEPSFKSPIHSGSFSNIESRDWTLGSLLNA